MIQSLPAEAVHEKQLQAPVLGTLDVAATFGSNVTEHKKTPHVHCVCIYIWHMFPGTVLLFSVYCPLCSRGKRCPIHAAETIFHHQSHWWPQGCHQCYSPRSAPSLLTRTLPVLAFSPFLTLKKEKGNLRRFLYQKPFSSVQNSHTMKLFAQLLPPGCCLLLVQLATATSSAPSSADEWLQLCFWSQIPIMPLSFAPFHSCSLGSVEMGEGGMLMFLNLEMYFSVY